MEREKITGPLLDEGRKLSRGALHGLRVSGQSLEDALSLRRLRRAEVPDARRFEHVLRRLREPLPASEAALIQAIESERQRLLAVEEPLVDGSLGSAGLYDTGQTIAGACSVSKGTQSSLLLYLVIREFKPRAVIELGTNVGISAAYQAAALQTNGSGRLVTLEASPYRIRIARGLHEKLGLKEVDYVQGLFADTLLRVLQDRGPVDLAFIDGHHQYQPTLDYCDTVWEHAEPRAIFVFDDIRWSDGMRDAWSQLKSDQRFELAVDLDSMGVCIGAGSGTSTESRLITRPIRTALRKVPSA